MTGNSETADRVPVDPLPAMPRYSGPHLRNVLPSAAAALGLPGYHNTLGLPEVPIMVVMLIDGLGDAQLAQHTGHARFLASAWRNTATGHTLDVGVPSTTATSLASFGTGLTPGEHGLVGYDVYAPHLDRVVNMLGGWDAELDPHQWQPRESLLQRFARRGVRTATVSRPQFRDSQLTRAVLSNGESGHGESGHGEAGREESGAARSGGGEFVGVSDLGARFQSVREWLRAAKPTPGQLRQGPAEPILVYFYVDELDKAGHQYGVDSPRWRHTLETIDKESAALVGQLKAEHGENAAVVLTADHGMIDVASQHRIDVSGRADLLTGVAHTAGEPRLVQLHCTPAQDLRDGVADSEQRLRRQQDLVRAWTREFGDVAWVVTREEAIKSGWFGEADPRVQPRIGDVLVAAREPVAIYHTDRTGPQSMAMIGQHGSLTPAERVVPLVELTGLGFTAPD